MRKWLLSVYRCGLVQLLWPEGRQVCLYTPTNPHLGRGWHKPFAHTGPFSTLSVLRPQAEPPPQGQLSSLGALHVVSTWAPASPLNDSLPLQKMASRWWKAMCCWGTLLYLLYFSAEKVPLGISFKFSFLLGAWGRGPQKGCGSGCLVWTNLRNVLLWHLEINFWPISWDRS